MNSFAYFENRLIEVYPGTLGELREQFQVYESALRELEVERGKRIRLETELGKLKRDIQTGNVREDTGGHPSSSCPRRRGISHCRPKRPTGSSLKAKAIIPGLGRSAYQVNDLFGNGLAPPSKKLEQLWTLPVESCLPDFEPETRMCSIESVVKVNIPYTSQQDLLGFICGNISPQGQDWMFWNCSRSLHCLRLLESLLSNRSMRFEEHLDCIKETIEGLFAAVASRLEGQPTCMTLWELLDSGASLLRKMAKRWKTLRHALRLTEIFVLEIAHGRDLPVMTLYHTISTVLELGDWETLTLVLPNLPQIGNRFHLEEQSTVWSRVPKLKDVAIKRIGTKIVDMAAPMLALRRKLPDPLLGYDREFGEYFGEKLFHRVQELRKEA